MRHWDPFGDNAARKVEDRYLIGGGTGNEAEPCDADGRSGARGLAKHPRVRLRFTPTSSSWLNLVEVFFGIITRQAIRRGSFTSVKDLVAAIRRFVDGWNERCHPFV